ncbi:DUF3759 domain-containing protein [Nocardia sp. NPDC020380]|uniref:DUF3759 domain-containing protein n=1 Tax=Nocardia sp. NPDC020380 TaxID=3364309 RepID=UPI0037A563AE
MGLFDMFESQHNQVYGGQAPENNWTHELIAGAAGFEAMRMYEHHREREGIQEHHELGKELIAGFACAEVDKHFENRRLNHLEQEQARQQAAQQAQYLYDQQYGQYYPPQQAQYLREQQYYPQQGQPYYPQGY